MSEKSFVKNAADPKQVQRAGEKAVRGREREISDILWILSDPRGRRFFWRYLGICGVFRQSFTGNSTTFFNEGERNVGLKLLSDLNDARPEAYIEMMKEAKNKEINESEPETKKEDEQ